MNHLGETVYLHIFNYLSFIRATCEPKEKLFLFWQALLSYFQAIASLKPNPDIHGQEWKRAKLAMLSLGERDGVTLPVNQLVMYQDEACANPHPSQLLAIVRHTEPS